MLTAITFWVVILVIPTGDPLDESHQTAVTSSTAAYTELTECNATKEYFRYVAAYYPGARVSACRLVHVPADEWGSQPAK